MGKVKDRKSDSWKPGMVPNTSGMISKNQKRKEKRLSQSLHVVKSNSADTPSKKLAFGPLNKLKENLNSSLNLPSSVGKKKENKLLSTSLPIKDDKKSVTNNQSPQKKKAKLVGILSNSNTPMKKSNKVTFSMVEDDVDNFIDSEAEEGEEPVTDKMVKVYEKGSQKRQLKRKMPTPDDENSSDEDSDSDDEAFDSAESFVDMEASEGEETDEGEEDSDSDLSDFIEEESEDEDEEDNDDAEDDDSDEESDNDVKPSITPARRESVVLPSMIMKQGNGKKNSASTPLTEKINEKSQRIKVTEKSQPNKVIEKSKPTKVNVKSEPVKDQAQQQQNVEKKKKTKEDVKKGVVETVKGDISDFVGFIRMLGNNITDDAIRTALTKKVKSQNIVNIISRQYRSNKKKRNVFVYLKDEESLLELLNNKFAVGENLSFTVYKARESVKENKKERFLAFLPRIPNAITAAELKEVFEKEVGADAVLNVKFKGRYKKLDVRNALVEFADKDSLQKVVVKGECKVGDNVLVVRTAFEACVQIPTFKVVFTSVPEKTLDTALKKAIESQVGKDTILSIRFSARKPSFAFVALKNEDAKKKALQVGNSVSVNGTKLKVMDFLARQPRKRAAPSEQAKERKKNKNKKLEVVRDASTDSSKPPKKKFKKNETSTASMNGNVSATVAGKKKQKNSPKAVDTQSDSKKEAQNTPLKNSAVKAKNNKPLSNAIKVGNMKQSQSPSPAVVAVNSGNSLSPKQKKKNKQFKQQSPKPVDTTKPVDTKKKALALKIQAKNKKKQKGAKKEE